MLLTAFGLIWDKAYFFSQNIFFILIGMIGIGFLIGFHELGHFLFCKIFKISTPSFSIGFGPRIFSKKIGDTEFALSAIPLGGYVEIAGSAEMGQGEQSEADRTDQYSFAIKPYYQKLLVMLGGILFNIIFAYFALILVFMSGLPKTHLLFPKNAIPVIQSFKKPEFQKTNALKIGDKILAINDIKINNNAEQLINLIKPLANQKANLLIERNNEVQIISTEIAAQALPWDPKTTIGTLNVYFEIIEVPGYTIIESIKKGINLTHDFILMTLRGFASIFREKDVSQLSGPLMIISMTVKGAEQGIKIFLVFLALISINLAVLNLIPLPILDGGQILFYTIEAIIRRPLPMKVKEYIHIASWLAILLLTLYLSAKDIARIASPYIEGIMKFFGPYIEGIMKFFGPFIEGILKFFGFQK